MQKGLKTSTEKEIHHCPYLDTVNRKVLDFDLEKECSISLSHQNVYICLVCGEYLQGRGEQTHAYIHSLQNSHHVFMNIETKKFYCIPDNYEIEDPSLDDIRAALDPEYTDEDIKKLDKNEYVYTTPSGDEYLPGAVGVNVIGKSDYVNAVVHALAHVNPIRDFFLKKENYAYSRDPLLHSFGVLMRKIWSHNRFKANVSPHEFLNEVSRRSKNVYNVKERKDATVFLRWLMNMLNIGLKDKEHKTTIIEQCFKGKIEVTTKKYTLSESKKRSREEMLGTIKVEESTSEMKEVNFTDYDIATETKTIDYLMLSLDLPPIPLFKNSNKDSVVTKIPLYSILSKYDGITATKEIWDNTEKSYRIVKLPRYLTLVFNRFTKNEFFHEKNTTIVQFPIRDFEMKDFLFTPIRPATKEIVMKMSETPLKLFITHNGESVEDDRHFDDLRKHALEMVNRGTMLLPTMGGTKYDLVASICHDLDTKEQESKKKEKNLNTPINNGSYRVHVKNGKGDNWYEIQELYVKRTEMDLVSTSESSILIYERHD